MSEPKLSNAPRTVLYMSGNATTDEDMTAEYHVMTILRLYSRMSQPPTVVLGASSMSMK